MKRWIEFSIFSIPKQKYLVLKSLAKLNYSTYNYILYRSPLMV